MSTHATITIETAPGRFETVGCHMHGYPAHTGRLLLAFFSTPEARKRILKSGGIACLEDDGEIDRYRTRSRPEVNTCRQDAFNWLVDYCYLFTGGQWWLMGLDDKLLPLSHQIDKAPAHIIHEQGVRLRKLRRALPSAEERAALN